MLNAQPLVSPIKGWIDRAHRPDKGQGALIHIPVPKAAGLFTWSQCAEEDFQSCERCVPVPRPDREKLGVDRVMHFADTNSGRRIPWNTGLRVQMDMGYHGQAYHYQSPPN